LARRVDRGQLAFEVDLAGVGLGGAVDDAGEGRLAGAVLAGERVDLPRADREVDLVERGHTRERLGGATHFDQRSLVFLTYRIQFPVDPFPRGGVHLGSILDVAPLCGVECLKLFRRPYKNRECILHLWTRRREVDRIGLFNEGAGWYAERYEE